MIKKGILKPIPSIKKWKEEKKIGKKFKICIIKKICSLPITTLCKFIINRIIKF